MTAPLKHSPLHWWLSEPAPVAAVLSLAYLRDGTTDPVHDCAAQVYGAHAGKVVDLAATLNLIEDLGCKAPCEVMWDATGLDRAWTVTDCEGLRDEKKADAVTTAQFIASLHTLVGAA